MDEENEDDGLEWDKPQEFLDKSPEKELRNGKSVVKRCLPKMSKPNFEKKRTKTNTLTSVFVLAHFNI